MPGGRKRPVLGVKYRAGVVGRAQADGVQQQDAVGERSLQRRRVDLDIAAVVDEPQLLGAPTLETAHTRESDSDSGSSSTFESCCSSSSSTCNSGRSQELPESCWNHEACRGGDWSGRPGHRCDICGRRSEFVGPTRGFDYNKDICGGCCSLSGSTEESDGESEESDGESEEHHLGAVGEKKACRGDWSGRPGHKCDICGRRSEFVGPTRGFDYNKDICGGCCSLSGSTEESDGESEESDGESEEHHLGAVGEKKSATAVDEGAEGCAEIRFAARDSN
jgi:hypothetical protein